MRLSFYELNGVPLKCRSRLWVHRLYRPLAPAPYTPERHSVRSLPPSNLILSVLLAVASFPRRRGTSRPRQHRPSGALGSAVMPPRCAGLHAGVDRGGTTFKQVLSSGKEEAARPRLLLRRCPPSSPFMAPFFPFPFSYTGESSRASTALDLGSPSGTAATSARRGLRRGRGHRRRRGPCGRRGHWR